MDPPGRVDSRAKGRGSGRLVALCHSQPSHLSRSGLPMLPCQRSVSKKNAKVCWTRGQDGRWLLAEGAHGRCGYCQREGSGGRLGCRLARGFVGGAKDCPQGFEETVGCFGAGLPLAGSGAFADELLAAVYGGDRREAGGSRCRGPVVRRGDVSRPVELVQDGDGVGLPGRSLVLERGGGCVPVPLHRMVGQWVGQVGEYGNEAGHGLLPGSLAGAGLLDAAVPMPSFRSPATRSSACSSHSLSDPSTMPPTGSVGPTGGAATRPDPMPATTVDKPLRHGDHDLGLEY